MTYLHVGRLKKKETRLSYFDLRITLPVEIYLLDIEEKRSTSSTTSVPILKSGSYFRRFYLGISYKNIVKIKTWYKFKIKAPYLQCCGSELFFFLNSDSDPQFFSDSDSVFDSDQYTNILSRNCLKWCLSLLLCVLESVRQRKKFPN
jgi:hypothetical protein